MELRDLQNRLHEQCVDVHQPRLQQVQRQHRHLGMLAVPPGEIAVLAVEDDVVGGIPVLHHLQPAVDLAPQLGCGEVVAGEDCSYGAAQLLQRLVGRVFRSAAGEPAQDRLGLGGAQPQRCGVLDHLVVLLGDQLPQDGSGQHRTEFDVGRGVVWSVQPHRADVLQPGQQPEPEQFGEGEPDYSSSMRVNVIRLDVHLRAVPQQSFDHGRDLARGARLELRVDAGGAALDVHTPDPL